MGASELFEFRPSQTVGRPRNGLEGAVTDRRQILSPSFYREGTTLGRATVTTVNATVHRNVIFVSSGYLRSVVQECPRSVVNSTKW